MIPVPEERGGSVSRPDTQSFILKVWIEEHRENSEKLNWRGHITHVPSAEKQSVKTLTEVGLFIGTYLRSVNVPVGVGWRLRFWLRSLMSRVNG